MNFKTLTTMFALFFALQVVAEPVVAKATAKDPTALQRLTAQLAKIQSFASEFVQYTVDEKGTRIQQVGGEIKAARPGKFYWHTKPPLEQYVVSDGVNVTVYDPDLEQATIQPVDQTDNTPALLLSGNTRKIGENFNVSYKNWDGMISQYVLRPKAKDSPYTSLKLQFDKDNLVEMRLIDSLGQESTIGFYKPKLNPKLAKDAFTLKMPKDTDIIRDILKK
jgi:outer membrane lipoprotein carrier protein